MEAKQRKRTAAVTAGALALVIALAGTFAWQSISQEATNEAAGVINPGGRLHDDFDGTNKDVYVENFTDATNGGQPIYARVRLDEYMEIGTGAGLKNGEEGYAEKTATSLIEGASIDDLSTWKPHVPDAEDDPFHEYFEWATGGSTIYMPTFNKNKDSLKADINGTFEGTTAGDSTHYDDYVTYTDGQEKTEDAIYDADPNDVDEGDEGVPGENYTTESETHTAKATLEGNVMTMAEWIEAGSEPGPYWVWDTDGWAYWAQAIQPGEATGLLLDEVGELKDPNGTWYYGINVVGQFVTAEDIGSAETGTGFFSEDAGSTPTEEAMTLLRAASTPVSENQEIIDAINAIEPGSTTTVTIDGLEYYVLVNDEENDQALLFAKEALGISSQMFGTSNIWRDSDIRNYLNGEWLDSMPTIKTAAVEKTITTRESHEESADWIETQDKVFLLSEADVFGTNQGRTTSESQDYTYGTSKFVPESLKTIGSHYWLRSPYGKDNYLALVQKGGTRIYVSCTGSYGVRPALWINLAS